MKAIAKESLSNRTGRCLAAAGLAIVLGLAAWPHAAVAAPDFLWQAPADGKVGSEAGRLDHPAAVAVDAATGHVFVSENFNHRVSEFDAWGRFIKAWGWGVRDGTSELQTCGPGAIPPSAVCLKGIPGSGPGQFRFAMSGVAVDANGNIYVGDKNVDGNNGSNNRVQKFGPNGNFLLMFGKEVNKGPIHPGNVCTATHITEGDTCGAGIAGEGPGELQPGSDNALVVGPAGTIFVGSIKGRIHEFDPNGGFKSTLVLEGELSGNRVESMAIDGTGNFYVKSDGNSKAIYKFDPTGNLISSFAAEIYAEGPVAVDAFGNLYVVVEKPGSLRREVVEFAPDGSSVIPAGSGFAIAEGNPGDDSGVAISGLAVNTVTSGGGVGIYLVGTSASALSHVKSFGPPPDRWSPPTVPPDITSQYAVSVDSKEALLRAQINPLFWVDTSYYVEYGTDKCSEGGCTAQQPIAPGVHLGAGITSELITTKGVFLTGLLSDTTYHYRFVARSSGGGPVHGVGGKVGADGEEGSFTTLRPDQAPSACSNASVRSGVSAFLADCRAYEMVSPIDKNGADIFGLCGAGCDRAEINQASLDGGKITYSSHKAFGDAISGPYVSQYIATRGAAGWSTHGISPPYVSGLLGGNVNLYYTLEPEFKAFSSDLSSSWITDSSKVPLTADAVEGFTNIYHQDNLSGDITALTRTEPKFAPSPTYRLEFQGRSADGGHVVFRGAAALTPDAAANSNDQLYDFSDGKLHLVSVLPNGTANPYISTLGTLNTFGEATHGFHRLDRAVSDDGSRIFWSSMGDTQGLFLRVNPDQLPSELSKAGKCTQPLKACTYRVSDKAATFWTADPEASKALFGEGTPGQENLYEYDVVGKTKTLLAQNVQGVLGTSKDLSWVYFVSTEDLAAGATAGQPNLYLEREGSITHIAALLTTDAFANPFSPVGFSPSRHPASITPDGHRIAFMSAKRLTGYDNTDVSSGKADFEVFTYDADTDDLSCVSCNPTGVRPTGEELELPYTYPSGGTASERWAAAWLNPSPTSHYTPNVLSEDGSRLFFNSLDALVLRDTNGVQDVYQWEASGSGDCTTQSAFYSEPNGGCVSLISSGESPRVSEFIDASVDGSDVFFKTAASLDSQDPGLIDIYDARVEGGFPPPLTPPAPCIGDTCQSVPAPPSDVTPASATFRGAGNSTPAKPRRDCRARKGKATKSKHQNQSKQQKKRCQRAKRRAGR